MAKPKTAEEQKQSASSELAQALVEAINITKPEAKKTISTRAKKTPWTPEGGEKNKLKLKKKVYQHGLLVDPNKTSNEEIALMNQLKPGVYCDGRVKVIRRKDRGLDIDYTIKTNSQRLRLINDHGIVSFKVLLETLVNEAKNPKKIEEDEVES